ncbi:uncharacterized protein LOC130191056 isoform X1 [Pseudoliparis swirei]|uniref:uncharacterized protein LOC130191056 isoform X1 n=1 Tax=Pseudoliparis swirei TaxID=2059687 RepID=UPI0024BEEE23|nr:uncharacterized protein LOC130191056 isoform X1 [Pseudoliparis swirei]
MHRLKVISGHLSSSGSPRYTRDVRRTECGSARGSSPQDVVVVHGPRTAIGKAKRGAFKDTTPDELLSAVMRAVLADVGLPPDRLGDVCVGNVLQPGAGAVMARVAHFLSGFPDTVPCYTVNRQCSSGLQAVFNIAVRPGRRQLRVPRHVLWRAGGGSGGDPDPRRGAALVPGHAEVHLQRRDRAEAPGRVRGPAGHRVLLGRLQQHLRGVVRLPGADRARHLLHRQRGAGRQRAELLRPGGRDGGAVRQGDLPVPVLLGQHQRHRGAGGPDPRAGLLRLSGGGFYFEGAKTILRGGRDSRLCPAEPLETV